MEEYFSHFPLSLIHSLSVQLELGLEVAEVDWRNILQMKERPQLQERWSRNSKEPRSCMLDGSKTIFEGKDRGGRKKGSYFRPSSSLTKFGKEKTAGEKIVLQEKRRTDRRMPC